MFYKESVEEKNRKTEIAELKKELKSIPMVDEFPKYARLERQIKKLSTESNKISQARSQSIVIRKCVLIFIVNFIQLLISGIVIWMYKSEPVVEIESKWVFPISSLLSMPSGSSGVISAFVWIIICRCAISQIHSIFFNDFGSKQSL
ncbi:hypothetical protein HELRODRAFT_159697 [Helobdella robusta]|uniref:Guided entry of tail-anchored proteins factor 1 n=1 Tax=Helobdella robusta TaxID=6412 RepID=T1EPB6_HELRO|nr:hypothetical protein HELRODRAFT_159697 [Helobdella robusta]ESO13092.1 hypothetical protein HELRODRAFT_159697 [Helobdella robusta]